MSRQKSEIHGYLSSQSWYPRYLELLNKYQNSEAYKESILAGNKREYTLLSSFPFKELDEEEKIEWIERHNEFFFWFRGMKVKTNSIKKNGAKKARRQDKALAITLYKRMQSNGGSMPRGKEIYQDPIHSAKRNLEAAKLYLARRRQKKEQMRALKSEDDKNIQK